jgi:hypothetical protein
MERDVMSDEIKLRICVSVFAICLVNFALFFIGAVYLGGDAVNGKIFEGHYFLMSHGRYTEVSADIFNYSKWHAYSTWVTHPLAFAAGFWYWRVKRAAGAEF